MEERNSVPTDTKPEAIRKTDSKNSIVKDVWADSSRKQTSPIQAVGFPSWVTNWNETGLN